MAGGADPEYCYPADASTSVGVDTLRRVRECG
jgi:hypothetical protein